MEQAGRKTVTYCLSYSITLTRRCAYACGYCDYAVTPSQPLPSPRALRKALRRAERSGAVQVEFTGGEGIADLPETVGTVRYYGLGDYGDYLAAAARMAAQGGGRHGLLAAPHLGNLPLSLLRRLKPFIACLKVFVESADPMLLYHVAHGQAEGKMLEKRLDTLLNAGLAGIPTTTGILVGIGERPESRERALRLIAEIQRRHGHIQNVVIGRFVPKPKTPMADWPAAPLDEVLAVVALARRILDPGVAITVPVAENPDLLEGAVEAGAGDFGDVGVSGVADADDDTLHRLHLIGSYCESRGIDLRERLPVFPSHQSRKWLSPLVYNLVQFHLAPELVASGE
ncbi:MAG: radical SAM protein [Candidatus Sumerlaeota bacterium]|nr:radical SAM protein [Candidatus Sumerlaeota bacterium]